MTYYYYLTLIFYTIKLKFSGKRGKNIMNIFIKNSQSNEKKTKKYHNTCMHVCMLIKLLKMRKLRGVS